MWRFASFYRSPFVKVIKTVLFTILLTLIIFCCFNQPRKASAQDFLPPTEYDQEIDKKQKGLLNVKRKISRQKKKARKMKKEEVYILARLSRIDKAIDASRTSLKEIREEQKKKKKESRELSSQLTELETDFTRRKEVITHRLIGIYKAKRLGFANLVWSSKRFTEFWRRYKLIKQIAAADGELFDKLKSEYKEISLQKAAVEKKSWEIIREEEKRKKELRQLEGNQKEKKKLLTSVRRRKKTYQQAAAELESAAANLKELLDKLAKEKKDLLTNRYGSSPVYQEKGQLLWPTNGLVSREFGRQKHPEFGTFYDYQGIDISAPLGQPVKAAAKGIVRYADWFRGYGKIVILDHQAGFFTLYGHLGEIKVKVANKVKKSQVVGTVGDTGSMRGPHLYFEIRQSGQQLNPRLWLSKK